MKQLQKFLVKRAFGTARVGDIVQLTGMRRDELKALGWIKPLPEEPAPVAAPVVAAPEPEPEPEREPVEAVAEDEDVETATRRRGRPRKGW